MQFKHMCEKHGYPLALCTGCREAREARLVPESIMALIPGEPRSAILEGLIARNPLARDEAREPVGYAVADIPSGASGRAVL